MAIVSETYYSQTYFGEPVAAADFPRFDARAEEIIAQITHGQASESNFWALSSAFQELVKKAICAQIEYYAINGIELASAGRMSSSFSVGKVSASGGQLPTGRASMVCPAAISFLEQTGLLNPQVTTAQSNFLPFWFGGGGV